MKRYQLILELHEDVVFSARSATLGGHRSLDYIPGAALYGVSASKLYDSLGRYAFTVFHSGKVRFGNGYPLAPNGEVGFPVPFSWYSVKGETQTSKSENWLVDKDQLYTHFFQDGNHPAGKLSGGQKQMVAVARAIVEPRDLLIVDEPSKGLAPASIENMIAAFAQLKAGGTTIVLVEQNLAFALKLADYVYVLSKGKIVHTSSPDELMRNNAVKSRYLGV